MRWVALLLNVVPGLGHMYLRYYRRGLVLLVLFFAGLNLFFLSRVWTGAEPIERIALLYGSLAILLGTYVTAFVNAWGVGKGIVRRAGKLPRTVRGVSGRVPAVEAPEAAAEGAPEAGEGAGGGGVEAG